MGTDVVIQQMPGWTVITDNRPILHLLGGTESKARRLALTVAGAKPSCFQVAFLRRQLQEI